MLGDGSLRGDSGYDCIFGPGECDKQRISLRVDLVSSILLVHSAKQPPIRCQHVRVAIAQLLEQARGPFDVGEEERDRPGR
jgi:hypothetical protein